MTHVLHVKVLTTNCCLINVFYKKTVNNSHAMKVFIITTYKISAKFVIKIAKHVPEVPKTNACNAMMIIFSIKVYFLAKNSANKVIFRALLKHVMYA
jgi:hypothetical protein